MSIYERFETDAESEIEGIILDYGDCKIRVSRAGGKNLEYAKLLEKRTRALRKNALVSEEAYARILREVFAETIIKEWKTKVGDTWLPGIENPDGGTLLPATTENIVKTFTALPDLFSSILEQVTTASNYLAAGLEEERKN